ncbi:cytochrome ubiquinol oxidase subunit I [Paucilactobacillus sp. N302-9]
MFSSGLSIVFLARWQFAMTTIFHFFFVPFSIGLGFVVAIMETLYVIKKKDLYKQMTIFWGKIFLLSFAVGVVTGLIQEFQFGMNWSEYSRFMGDIFGAPLAIEALAAFFMESTFIGLWIFTWDKLPAWAHCATIWLTSIGTMISALWILAANSFMQNPVGYMINKNTGRVNMVSFFDVVNNYQLKMEFPHVIFGAWLTAGIVIAGMSAWGLLKNKTENTDFWRKSIKVSLIVALIASLGSIASGDLQTQYVLKDQPMKFAAMEGVYKTTGKSAPWAAMASLDTKNHKTNWSLDVPHALSILSYHKTTGSVKGMNAINKELHAKYDKKFGKDINYYAPVKTLFWSFRIMAISGGFFALVAILGLIFNRQKSKAILNQRWFLYVLGLTMWLPFIANSTGWMVTEFGRYPWVVYGLLTIADAVSPNVSVGSLLFTNIAYFAVFACLGLVMIWLSHRELKKGPDDLASLDQEVIDPYAKEAFVK